MKRYKIYVDRLGLPESILPMGCGALTAEEDDTGEWVKYEPWMDEVEKQYKHELTIDDLPKHTIPIVMKEKFNKVWDGENWIQPVGD